MQRLRLVPKAPKRRRSKIFQAVNRLKQEANHARIDPFLLPSFPEGVAPKDAKMAMDDSFIDQNQWSNTQAWTFAAQNAYLSAYQEGLAFPGYAFLAELAQRPEYRRMSEIIATEMTRRWIKLDSVSTKKKEDEKTKNNQPEDEPKIGPEEDKPEADEETRKESDTAEKIKQLNDELDRLKVRDCFRKCIELDGFFGRSHLYIDTGYTEDREELRTTIGNGRNEISKDKIGSGAVKRLCTVEPVWTYPTNYNSIDPLKPEWYEPDTWYVMGKEIHRTRLLKFVGREVPDLLKPAYSFGGLSLSQMAMPYVNNWLRTRQSVSDIIHSFSVFVLKTDLSESLTEGGEELFQRVEAFNLFRDNKGVMLTDKENEDFSNISAPLGSLDHLQAQSQEHLSSVSGIPLVKLTGISPSGLNATSEFEIRAFYDWILAFQEKLIRPHLTTIIDMVELSLWGKVDDDITFSFEPLWSLDEKGRAEVNQLEAQTGASLIEAGVVSQEEERKRIASEPDSPYADIDVDTMPELRQEEEEGLMPKSGAAKLAEGAGEEQGEIDVPNKGSGGAPGGGGGAPGAPEDEAPSWDKKPYEEGHLRPEYLKGRHTSGKDYLDQKYLDTNYLKKRLGIPVDADDAEPVSMEEGQQHLLDLMAEGLKLLAQQVQKKPDQTNAKERLQTRPSEIEDEDDDLGPNELMERAKKSNRYLSSRYLEDEHETDPDYMKKRGGENPRKDSRVLPFENEAEPLIGAFDSGGHFEESKHPRGQPGNSGQFGSGGGGKQEKYEGESETQTKPVPKPVQISNMPGKVTRAAIEKSMVMLNQQAEKMEIELKDPDSDRTYAAISFMNSIVELDKKVPLSQRKDYRFAYAFGESGDNMVGAIVVQRVNSSTAEIKYLGSIQSGAGEKLLKQGEQEARGMKASKIQLTGNAANRSFYERHGYKMIEGGEEHEVSFIKDLTKAQDEAFDLSLSGVATAALQSAVSYITQTPDESLDRHIEYAVNHFADIAKVSHAKARQLLGSAIHARQVRRPKGAHDAEFNEADHDRDTDGKFTSGGGGGGTKTDTKSAKGTLFHKAPLNVEKLKHVGKQLGSNYGFKGEDENGKKYYVKKGKTPDHAKNELLAAKLYKLAGTQTQKYRDVEGGWVATEWQDFDKSNAKDFTPAELKEAQKDFAVHAWTANWDAAGLDYDNQVIIKGRPASIDLGGALMYRAQGQPKGNAFGNSVGEWDSLRDKNINYQNAKLFGSMTPEQLKESAHYVTDIPDGEIKKVVKEAGMPAELADKLIARKNDIAKRAKTNVESATKQTIGDSKATVAFRKGMEDMPKSLHGVEFKSWQPPEDWADVEGQIELDEHPIDAGKKSVSSGLLIQEKDGRVWLVKPSNMHGGYRFTFPKGGQEKDLSLQANAIKEAYEESGLKGRVVAFAGDFEGDTTVTRFYHAIRETGSPVDHGWESEAVVLASPHEVNSLLNRSRDRKIAESITWKGAHDKATNFKESEHPRQNDGKFSEGAGGGGSSAGEIEDNTKEAGGGVSKKHLTTKFVDGKRVTEEGNPLPEHITKLRIPPAWTDVTYASDAGAALQVTGKDAKGRSQSIYSTEHTGKQAALKFARIKELDQKFDAIMKQNDEAVKSADLKTKDSAECLALIAAMGIRPGSEADTGGARKAYGATTLQGRHVVRTPAGTLYLRFVGKKGVDLSLKVTDEKIAEMLERRAKESGGKGKLFPNTTDKALLDHVHSLDGGGFTSKDFRTYIGTKTALQLVEATKKIPEDMKGYKKAVREVAKKVSDVLGNTPAIALTSYINPTVFAQWQEKIA